METATTAPSFWLNWRVLLCAIWILVALVFAALLIWKYEGHSRNQSSGDQHEAAGVLYEDEVWGACSESIQPIWLLAYRVVAFCALLVLLLADTIIHNGQKYSFYTQWTFTLVTFYFGLGSSLSIHGCLRYFLEVKQEKDYCIVTDAECGPYTPPTLGEIAKMPRMTGSLNHHCDNNCRIAASVWGYALQIVFQMCAGAVVLTDSVFWLIIYPFLTPKNYRLNLLVVCMHSVNAVLLLGDAILNSLRFPFFRVAYFVLWTSIYVIFQWIVHACISMRWPYPFLDLSSSYAPLWYLAMGLLMFPCFGVFNLIHQIKQCCLSRKKQEYGMEEN